MSEPGPKSIPHNAGASPDAKRALGPVSYTHLDVYKRQDLREVGWTKGLELAKLARRDGQHFDCATWLHKARALPKEDFRREVEKELTGKEEEPSELIYFKVYKSQIPVIEQAIETASLMLGTDTVSYTHLSSSARFAHSGIGTVRMCPPLPIKSTTFCV